MKKIILFLLCSLIFIGIIVFYVTHHKTSPLPKTVVSPPLHTTSHIEHVFVIVMENTNWSTIKDSRSAPYINSLLHESDVSYATQYYVFSHPSEPNYIWMEAGESRNLPNGKSTVNLTSDSDPTESNSSTTTDHLVSLLEQKKLSWKVYAEGVDGTECPTVSSDDAHFAARHIPMLFFQDVTRDTQNCIKHIRPYAELTTDLTNNTVPAYSFIVPDLCDNMHDLLECGSFNRVNNGDSWLARNIPLIQESQVFSSSTIFLTWDEGSGGSKTPIGMIVISPFAKGKGYHNTIHYSHSSLVRTIQEIFSIKPLLRDAANANDLKDLFTGF